MEPDLHGTVTKGSDTLYKMLRQSCIVQHPAVTVVCKSITAYMIKASINLTCTPHGCHHERNLSYAMQLSSSALVAKWVDNAAFVVPEVLMHDFAGKSITPVIL